MAIRTIRSGGTQHTEASVLQLITDLVTGSGVLDLSADNHFLVTAQTPTPTMHLDVAAGKAYIRNTSGNTYPIYSTATGDVTIPANGAGNPVINSVVLYMDMSASPNSDSSNVAKLAVVTGTPGASPSPPDATAIGTAIGASNPYIVLANVLTGSGVTSITSDKITDVRPKITISSNFSPPGDGWIANSNTWTYSSVDGPTGVVTVNADLTGVIQVGDRVKFTQTSVKYFIVTAISYASSVTTIKLYGGTDYTLANAGVTNPAYSHAKSPFGFPTNPSKWTVETKNTSSVSQSSPVISTWYNLGSISIEIPIGLWNVEYFVNAFGGAPSSNADCHVTLSTGSSSETDSDFSTELYTNAAQIQGFVNRRKILPLTNKTTYYLNAETTNGATTIRFDGPQGSTIIRAVCAYL